MLALTLKLATVNAHTVTFADHLDIERKNCELMVPRKWWSDAGAPEFIRVRADAKED